MHKLRPLFALFLRSLREDTRSRLPTILRFTIVAVILVILWENQRSFGRGTAPGREFFTYVMLLNLGIIGIAALSIFPSAIAEEKEDETLTLLRMTNLSPVAILFGKSTSRFVGALLLLAVQVPFTLLAITLGGVSLEQVWHAYAVLAVTTFFLCNLALFASVICRTSLRAGFFTAAIGLALYVGLPIAYAIVVDRAPYSTNAPGVTPTTLDNLLLEGLNLNPVWALVTLLQGGVFMKSVVPQHVTINLIAGTLFFLTSWLLFDRYCARVVDVAPKPKRKPKEGKRHRWGWVTRTWTRFPLAWKDFHFLVGGRLAFYIRLVCAFGATVAVILYGIHRRRNYSYNFDTEDVGAVMLVIAGWCAALEIILLASRIFGVERRRQTLSSLVGLPWTTGKLIRQKLLGVLPALAPWMILAMAGAFLCWDMLAGEIRREFGSPWRSPEMVRDMWTISAYFLLQGIILILLVTWFSLKLRRGGLPAAIAISALWNILFGITVDAAPRRDEFIVFAVGDMLSLLALALLARSIYNRIPAVASEES